MKKLIIPIVIVVASTLIASTIHIIMEVKRQSNFSDSGTIKCPFDTMSIAPPHASYFLPVGTIFGISNSKGKIYRISKGEDLFLDVFSKEFMAQTTCFNTVKDAEITGYKLDEKPTDTE